MFPNFANTALAFQLKTDAELKRACYLFKFLQNPWLVKFGTVLLRIALHLHLPIKGLVKATVFDHFCGGVTQKDCLFALNNMYKKGVFSILDYSVEGKATEAQSDFAMEKFLQGLYFSKEKQAIPFVVCKPTALGRLALYEKVSAGKALNTAETAEWQRVMERYDTLCKKALDLEVSLLLDAEESWMQEAADTIALEMMRRYNTTKAVVFNTLQLYRCDRLAYLKDIHQTAMAENFKLGLKIVRGAYLEKENKRARQRGYKSPVCPSKSQTDNNFNAALAYSMEHLTAISLFVGTHNEESCYTLIRLMKEKKVVASDPRVWFGQLYGMSDHITFNLAAAGYNAAKYVPYGPVKEVMPYLIRRAEENAAVVGQTSREFALLQKEKQRRAAGH